MRKLCSLALLTIVAMAPSPPTLAQDICPTNYCIRSQSTSYQTPPGWPNVGIEACCEGYFGSLPDEIDWSGGTPVMLCTGSPDYGTAFPNCGDPRHLSYSFALSYERPKIRIGVAWPNPKNYLYSVESIPITAGADGTCVEFSGHARGPASWWIYEIKSPQVGSYVFTAAISFERGSKGYYAVLNKCRLHPPGARSARE